MDNPSDAAINVCASLKIKILAGPAPAVGPKRKGTLIDSPPGPPGMGALSSEGKVGTCIIMTGEWGGAGKAPIYLQFIKVGHTYSYIYFVKVLLREQTYKKDLFKTMRSF